MLKVESAAPIGHSATREEAEQIYSALSSRELLALLNSASLANTLPSNFSESLQNYFGIFDLKLQSIYKSWNDLSLHFSIVIESMQSEAYIATRYFDFRVAEIGLRAAARGCAFKVLHSPRSGLSTKLQVLGNLMTHPKALGIFRKIPSSANVSIGEVDLPFSFAVIDSSKVGLEIVREDNPEAFFLGVEFDSPLLASKLVNYFNEISKIAHKEVDGLVGLDAKDAELKLGLNHHINKNSTHGEISR
jgi:hypothetical protein